MITADVDSAYAISALQMRDFRIVLMSPSIAHLDLTSQAAKTLDWSRGALGINGDPVEDHDIGADPAPPASAPPHFTTPFTPPSSRARGLSGGDADNIDPRSSQQTPSFMPTSGLRGRFQTESGPAQGPRRRSAFSTDKYGPYWDEFVVPPKPTAFGDGPQLSQTSKLARADSAPPHAFYSDVSPPPGLYHMDFAKGKERENTFFEPEEPTGGVGLPYSSSVFEPFKEENSFRASTASLPSQAEARRSSFSSIASSAESSYSFVDPSTAPTSADPAFDEKSTEGTIKPSFSPHMIASHAPAASQPVEPRSGSGTVPAASNTVQESVEAEKASQTPAVLPPAQASSSTASVSKTPVPAQSIPPAASDVNPAGPSVSATASETTKPILPPAGASKTLAVPDAWVPLVKTLRRHGGVSSLQFLPVFLLKTDPNAYSRAGQRRWTPYFKAAISAGIITTVVDSDGEESIQLTASYA